MCHFGPLAKAVKWDMITDMYNRHTLFSLGWDPCQKKFRAFLMIRKQRNSKHRQWRSRNLWALGSGRLGRKMVETTWALLRVEHQLGFWTHIGHWEKPYWGNHFWSKGYCVDTVGLDPEMIRKYVKYQEAKEHREEQAQRQLFWSPFGTTQFPCPLGAKAEYPLSGVTKEGPSGVGFLL